MNTSGTRDRLDRWYTPPAAARVVVASVGLKGWRGPVVCIGSGGGVFPREIRAFGFTGLLIAADVDPAADRLEGVADFVPSSFEDLDLAYKGAIVGPENPPFSRAAEIIEHALDCGAVGVHLLLPLSFRGSEERLKLWGRLQSIGVMHPRITYGGPARDAKIAEAKKKGTEFSDASNGDSAVFSFSQQRAFGARIFDLPRWE
jgi:hypothetical protein